MFYTCTVYVQYSENDAKTGIYKHNSSYRTVWETGQDSWTILPSVPKLIEFLLEESKSLALSSQKFSENDLTNTVSSDKKRSRKTHETEFGEAKAWTWKASSKNLGEIAKNTTNAEVTSKWTTRESSE